MPLPGRFLLPQLHPVPLWPLIEEAAAKHEVDPLLLAAVVDRESLAGHQLHPPGPGGTGDFGHGKGLCQVDERYHGDFCRQLMPDGTPKWADPASNLEYGAQLLACNLRTFQGDEVQALGAYNAGPHAVREAVAGITRVNGLPPPREAVLHTVDHVTTGHDYVTNVLQRRQQFRAPVPPKDSPPPEKPK